ERGHHAYPALCRRPLPIACGVREDLAQLLNREGVSVVARGALPPHLEPLRRNVWDGGVASSIAIERPCRCRDGVVLGFRLPAFGGHDVGGILGKSILVDRPQGCVLTEELG